MFHEDCSTRVHSQTQIILPDLDLLKRDSDSATLKSSPYTRYESSLLLTDCVLAAAVTVNAYCCIEMAQSWTLTSTQAQDQWSRQ